MATVFLRSRRKSEDVIDVGNAEGEVTEYVIHHSLKGGRRF